MSAVQMMRVWRAECIRCANSDVSEEVAADEAADEFMAAGWADEMCPACNATTPAPRDAHEPAAGSAAGSAAGGEA